LFFVNFADKTDKTLIMESIRQLFRRLSWPSTPQQQQQPANGVSVAPLTSSQPGEKDLSFKSREQLLDYVRQNLTRDEIQKLLDSTRPELPPDQLAEQILNRTRALEQLSVAHEYIYGLGKYLMFICFMSTKQ